MRDTPVRYYAEREGAVICVIRGYGNELIVETGLDPSTWRDLGDGYAQDPERVVYDGDPIDAAADSFVALGYGYAKDASTVLSRGKPALEPAEGPWDATSFRAFGARYVADRRGVFCIRYGYDSHEVVAVGDADPSDFEELGLVFARAPRAGVIYRDDAIDAQLDASTFQLRGRWFAVDRHAVYHLQHGGTHTDEVTLHRIDADPRSFAVLGAHYAADAERVFYQLHDEGDANVAIVRRLDGVSPAGFEILDGLDGYARAGSNILNHGVEESGIADPEHFEALVPNRWARDRLRIYAMQPRMLEMDGVQLEVLSPEPVDGADPAVGVPATPA